jgi:hypothetical protein
VRIILLLYLLNPRTTISWEQLFNSHVSLKIYDILGREVSTLVNEEKPAGYYKVTFDAKNLASGIYFYRLKAGKFIQIRKMVLMH